ncbi:MAG: aspartate--tRNA ligase [Clostridia bacterium]|nr:aspartate--tRNA ligase [Clostridia bacterium]
MNEYRTHNCGELRIENVGQKVKLAGWVQKIRNLGKMQFIDLRDEFGITQIIISDNEEMSNKTKDLTTECSVSFDGVVSERTNKNAEIPTGDIEIIASDVTILGKCKNVLPFEINQKQDGEGSVREDLRLEYRFLDLRNDKLHKNILLRSKILKTMRDEMDKEGFAEIQTPILGNSSPEGARDFLVPSRLHPGEFYALPQAPQQFKQLLMISGFNKYYQIAPCFRDEDPRADRSPGEFYQLDMEMSYATQEDVFEVMERVIPNVFKKNSDLKITEAPFVRIPYREAMDKYGTDKPDLRNPLIIEDATDIFKDTEFNAFKGKTIKVIKVDNMNDKPRKFFDQMSEFAVSELSAKGLAWVKVEDRNSLTGGISKFITEEQKEKLFKLLSSTKDSAIFFIADEYEKAQKIAGGVRIELGNRLDLLEKDIYKFCWIVDFPMYELSDEGTIDFNHNPFSMPQGGIEALNTKDPLDIYAYQYDLVCNGYELASGAVRNHNQEIMIKAFEIAGYKEDDVKNRFGALYNAFSYGTPPHAGVAPGVDRIVMLLAKEENIREVIAFPKNKKARDLLMRAPSKVSEEQLRDVHIKLNLEENDKENKE